MVILTFAGCVKAWLLVWGLTAGFSLFALGLDECNRKVSAPLESLDLNYKGLVKRLIGLLVVLVGGSERAASFIWFLEFTFLV
jgi:hypothetical protein